MTAVFTRLVQMSLSASLLILAVMALRLVLRRSGTPKWAVCGLWVLVALRLLLPALPKTAVSLVPAELTAGHTAEFGGGQTAPHPISPAPMAPNLSPAAPGQSPAGGAQPPATVEPEVLPLLAWVWAGGAAVILLWALWSWHRLRRQVAPALEEDGVWLCDHLQSPFILGILRPRIYLPSDLRGAERTAVVAHERAHLQRRDHWWKPLGFLLLALHWFNPMVWAAYLLLCRDIEAACDERVVRELSLEERKRYSHALLTLSLPRRQLAACPLAFGEVGVKSRIQDVLHYRKPTVWILLGAVLGAAIVAVCFLTDPKPSPATPLEEVGEDYTQEQAQSQGALVVRDWCPVSGWDALEDFYARSQRGEEAFLRVRHETEEGVTVYDLRHVQDFFTRTLAGTDGPHVERFRYFLRDDTNGTAYFLTDDPNMTYDKLMVLLVSSAAPGILVCAEPFREAIGEGAAQWLDFVQDGSKLYAAGQTAALKEFQNVTFTCDGTTITAARDGDTAVLVEGMPIRAVYFADLNGDGYRELCVSLYLGSGVVEEQIQVYDYQNSARYELSDRMRYDYALTLEGGELLVQRYLYPREGQAKPLAVGRLVLDKGLTVQWESQPDALEQAVSAAVLEYTRDMGPGGPIRVESHRMLKQQVSGELPYRRVTLDLLVCYQSFVEREGALVPSTGSCGPVVLTLEEGEPGDYTMVDYEEPQYGGPDDGDIQKRFPPQTMKEYAKALEEENHTKAQEVQNRQSTQEAVAQN